MHLTPFSILLLILFWSQCEPGASGPVHGHNNVDYSKVYKSESYYSRPESVYGNLFCGVPAGGGDQNTSARCWENWKSFAPYSFTQYFEVRGNGNGACANIPYPVDSDTGKGANPETLDIILSGGASSCVNIFDRENCTGSYLTMPKAYFTRRIILPFGKYGDSKLLENFPFRPVSLQPITCDTDCDFIMKIPPPTPPPGVKLILETKYSNKSLRTEEMTFESENQNSCNSFSSDFNWYSSEQNFEEMRLSVQNSGRSPSGPLCFELFDYEHCQGRSLRRVIHQVEVGKKVPLWRLLGSYRNPEWRDIFYKSQKDKEWSDYDVCTFFAMSSVRPCNPSREDDGRVGAGGAEVEVVFDSRRFKGTFVNQSFVPDESGIWARISKTPVGKKVIPVLKSVWEFSCKYVKRPNCDKLEE